MNAFSIDQLEPIFTSALSQVISTTTGLSLDALPSEYDMDFDKMIGFMSLNGKNQGIIFISAEETSMRLICSFMTGISVNEITVNDMEDALCELVNMTAGNARLRFNDTEQVYTLSPPFLIHGQNMSIAAKKRITVISKILRNEEISVKLKVIFY